ncbi:LapA family protein [Mycobacterium intracellulare]|uniref:LapA family protein n=1 Tax=Mycobacterium intracellulare TaxID=1767 RepID=UPI001F622975|nr:LapA family protein [Mycobacterium intracellulare]
MGDTARDPLDHQRSSRPRVGQALKNPAKAPGVLLVGAGVVALAICLACFADGRVGAGVAAAAVSLLTAAAGLAWLTTEARRLRELERQHTSTESRGRP